MKKIKVRHATGKLFAINEKFLGKMYRLTLEQRDKIMASIYWADREDVARAFSKFVQAKYPPKHIGVLPPYGKEGGCRD